MWVCLGRTTSPSEVFLAGFVGNTATIDSKPVVSFFKILIKVEKDKVTFTLQSASPELGTKNYPTTLKAKVTNDTIQLLEQKDIFIEDKKSANWGGGFSTGKFKALKYKLVDGFLHLSRDGGNNYNVHPLYEGTL